ncbi:hypothetical protein PIB30_007854 [Stylosanthes scabra]|uniref:Aminotransferase-like plant mobile domain-containing protein n=1 Tax=Stylosanthes scabra TaxID=79078 RepID=A0ABU6R522_9FABA|nr:hypothetical protein [Stylosanthes scabra]
MYRLDNIVHASRYINQLLGLPINGEPVTGCLSDFDKLMPDGRGKPHWKWFDEIFGVMPPLEATDAYTVTFSWFTSNFGLLLDEANKLEVRRHAQAYIMLLLSIQLFGYKMGARVPVWWIPFGDKLDDLEQYLWGSTAFAWLYMNLCRASKRNVVAVAGPLQLF